MKLLRTLGILSALLIPAAALAAPALKAACCDDPSCCPGCPLCDHAR